VRVFAERVHALVTHGRGDRIITGTLAEAPVLDTFLRPPYRRIETTMPHTPLRIAGLEDGRPDEEGAASGAQPFQHRGHTL
jgi:hypothetical protein